MATIFYPYSLLNLCVAILCVDVNGFASIFAFAIAILEMVVLPQITSSLDFFDSSFSRAVSLLDIVPYDALSTVVANIV